MLIRRAARIASRTAGGELLAVHISRSDGLAGAGPGRAAGRNARSSSRSAARYHSIVGDNVPRALLEFARSVDATQIVLGVSRRRRWAAALSGPGTSETVTRLSGPDRRAHRHARLRAARARTARSRVRIDPPAAARSALLVAAVLLAVVTMSLTQLRGEFSFASDLSIYLLVVVITSLVGRILGGGSCGGRRQPAAQLLLRAAVPHLHDRRARQRPRARDLPARRRARLAGRRPLRAAAGPCGPGGRGGRDRCRRSPAACCAASRRSARCSPACRRPSRCARSACSRASRSGQLDGASRASGRTRRTRPADGEYCVDLDDRATPWCSPGTRCRRRTSAS